MSTPTCDRIGCTSEKPPVWCPVLLLYARPNTEPARGRIYLRLCDDCRDRARTPEQFLSAESWMRMLAMFPKACAPPQRALTGLDFDFVDLDEDPRTAD